MPEVPTHEIDTKIMEKNKEKEAKRTKVPVMAD